MSRKTVIFGNGLGMALSPERFSLQYALNQVWNDKSLLRETQRALIRACLPPKQQAPCAEQDWDTLQSALFACDFLAKIKSEDSHWLNADGRDFCGAVRQLIYRTAKKFHDTGESLPNEFLTPLFSFIKKTKSHVCTLNYDNLLYGPMTKPEAGVFVGYEVLVDGFLHGCFNKQHLERRPDKDFGYYLHLHGSPLFYEDNGSVKKCTQGQFPKTVTRSPIVLTHVKHKPTVIASSDFLSCYWRYLRTAIQESEEVILFGYSGLDEHLNDEVFWSNQSIRVVEWRGAGQKKEREGFWQKRTGRDQSELTLIQLDDILKFTDW